MTQELGNAVNPMELAAVSRMTINAIWLCRYCESDIMRSLHSLRGCDFHNR